MKHFFKIYRENKKIVLWIFGIKIVMKNYFINYAKDACYIPNLEDILSRNNKFCHYLGIAIHENAKIGSNCEIFQRVVIGPKNPESGDDKAPTIGDNVIIYGNTCILGDIKIGDNSIIGANTVVLKDIPPNSIVAGKPGRVLHNR